MRRHYRGLQQIGEFLENLIPALLEIIFSKEWRSLCQDSILHFFTTPLTGSQSFPVLSTPREILREIWLKKPLERMYENH